MLSLNSVYNNGVKCILKVEENTTVSILMNK